jgi:hypothetical protein
MSERADASQLGESGDHVVSVVANRVNSQGVIVEWVVECYTEGCGFLAGPSDDVAGLREMRDRHLIETHSAVL